jgi:hypothetical protein
MTDQTNHNNQPTNQPTNTEPTQSIQADKKNESGLTEDITTQPQQPPMTEPTTTSEPTKVCCICQIDDDEEFRIKMTEDSICLKCLSLVHTECLNEFWNSGVEKKCPYCRSPKEFLHRIGKPVPKTHPIPKPSTSQPPQPQQQIITTDGKCIQNGCNHNNKPILIGISSRGMTTDKKGIHLSQYCFKHQMTEVYNRQWKTGYKSWDKCLMGGCNRKSVLFVRNGLGTEDEGNVSICNPIGYCCSHIHNSHEHLEFSTQKWKECWLKNLSPYE